MKKIKDFGSFMNEKNNIDNKVANENFSDIVTSAGGIVGLVSFAGFVGTIGSLIGSGVMMSLEGTKLGERGKEFAHKIKSIFNKGEQIKKQGGDEEAFADEVASELNQYQDVIDELNSGKLGEEGKKFANAVDKAKDAAEEVA